LNWIYRILPAIMPGHATGARYDLDPTPLGLTVRDLDRQTIERLDLPKQTHGVLTGITS